SCLFCLFFCLVPARVLWSSEHHADDVRGTMGRVSLLSSSRSASLLLLLSLPLSLSLPPSLSPSLSLSLYRSICLSVCLWVLLYSITSHPLHPLHCHHTRTNTDTYARIHAHSTQPCHGPWV